MIDLSKLNLTPSPGKKLINHLETPIPGQALTDEPRGLPSNRPPQYADVEDALDHILKRLLSDRSATQMLTMLQAGVPIAFLVEGIVTGGVQEGLWAAPAAFLLTPPLTVVMIRMAQAAKIDFVLQSGEKEVKQLPEMMLKMAKARVSSGRVDDAQKAGTQSAAEVKKRAPTGGIMSPGSFA